MVPSVAVAVVRVVSDDNDNDDDDKDDDDAAQHTSSPLMMSPSNPTPVRGLLFRPLCSETFTFDDENSLVFMFCNPSAAKCSKSRD